MPNGGSSFLQNLSLKVSTMKLQRWLGLAVALSPVGSAVGFNQSGNWTVASGQGYFEYYLHGPNNSRVELYCSPVDPSAVDTAYEGDIGFTLNGVEAPANMLVTLAVDGRKFLFRVPGKPPETSLPCPECSNLTEFWRAVRVSKTVEMRFADGRRVRFASAEGDKLLGKGLCQ